MISPTDVRDILDRHGFKFKKSLGQNFLIDANILDKILIGADINRDDNILEIGPGIGSLTQGLCERAAKVVAVEIDRRLLPILDETLEGYDNVHIVHGDILEVDLIELTANYFENRPFKVVANLPYYITSPIIMTFLESHLPYTDLVVMVQTEVADRILASPGTKTYGSLTVAVQYYTEANLIAKVPASVFMPQPKVGSAVIRLSKRDSLPLEHDESEIFFQVVKAAFSKRRKTILNALSSYQFKESMGDKDQIREILQNAKIEPNRRGETLSIEEFARLTQEFGKGL